MRVLKSLLMSALLVAAAGFSSAQSLPSSPNEKPNIIGGKTEKKDKSRLRDLKGSVHDNVGNPIESALVKVKDLKTGEIISAVTNTEGRYLFYDLSMDQDYELSASHQDYAPLTKKLSQYDARKPATINFELVKKKS